MAPWRLRRRPGNSDGAQNITKVHSEEDGEGRNVTKRSTGRVGGFGSVTKEHATKEPLAVQPG